MTEEPIRVSPGRPTAGTGGRPAGRDLEKQPLALIVLAVLSLMILIAAQIDDGFGAERAWFFVTILGAAYIVSRGLAAGRDRL